MPTMSRCKACGQRILWGATENGKNMPLDPTPTPDGNVATVESEGGRLLAIVLRPLEAAEARYHGRDLFVSHHSTCVLAEAFR